MAPLRLVALLPAARRLPPLFTRQDHFSVVYWSMLTKPTRRFPMNNPHSDALVSRHAGIDAQIADESRRPSPDQTVIATLKKQKLRIKEALSGL
jgi:hypothetical protein